MMKTTSYLVILVLLSGIACAQWQMFQHDVQNTGYNDKSSLEQPLENLQLLWKFQTNGEIRSSPAAYDINNDGRLEIMAGSMDSRVYAINYKGDELWSYPTLEGISSTPLVYDINNDKKSEILFGSLDGRFYAIDSNGKRLWRYKTKGKISSSPTVANIDGRESLEILFGSWDGNLYVLTPEGKKKWSYSTFGEIESSPALGDLDGDGRAEIIFGSRDNTLYAIDYVLFKVWRFQTNGDIVSSPTIADLDKNGKQDIIIGSEDGTLYNLYHQKTGEYRISKKCDKDGCFKMVDITALRSKWEYRAGGPITGSAAVADLNRDGLLDIVFGSTNRNLYMLQRDGDEKLKYTTTSAIPSSSAIADIDGDEKLEVVVASKDYLYVMDHLGAAKFWYKLPIAGSPIIADLDGNNRFEIIVGSTDGNIYVFGCPEYYDTTTTSTSTTSTSTVPVGPDIPVIESTTSVEPDKSAETNNIVNAAETNNPRNNAGIILLLILAPMPFISYGIGKRKGRKEED